jgi:hypothetical protein
MYKRIITGALLFGMAALAPPAHAMVCAPREGLVAALTGSYGETLAARGLQNARSIVELWTSAETGTFTVLVSRADGISCVLSTGTHWAVVPPVAAPPGIGG